MICDISENGGEGGSDSAQKGVLEASERRKISRKASLHISVTLSLKSCDIILYHLILLYNYITIRSTAKYLARYLHISVNVLCCDIS